MKAETKPLVAMWPVDRLKPYARNPRENEASVPKVAASIREFGFLVPIVARPDGEVLAGHTRLKAALSLGLETVPVLVAGDLDDAKARAFRLADNKVGESSQWDLAALDAELAALGDFDMVQFGFGEEADEPEEGETEADDAPGVEVDEAPISVPGAVYALGEHRLICGDSTAPGTVARLLGGERADLLVTDPPYNVDYEGGAGTIENDKMADAAFLAFLTRAFKAAAGALKPGAAFYIFHSDSSVALEVREAAKAARLRVHQCLIWVKNAAVMGRKDYQSKHEPCLEGIFHESSLYGWKEGAAHQWFSDRKQTTVLFFPKPAKSADHPTMKPVALLEALLHNSSERGDLVLDTFGGSTLIACERMGRRARLVELEPRFCDVIRRRWAEHVHGAGCAWAALTPAVGGEGEA